MAKSRKKYEQEFPPTQQIEVVAIKGKQVVKKIMSFGEAKQLKKAKGWQYIFYQVGFCSIKESDGN